MIILLQFWLQPVPYADLSGDNRVDFGDYANLCQLFEGDFWVAKSKWLCQNFYAGGKTELVEGWTYTVWKKKPVKNDRHPEIPGFNWIETKGDDSIISMNYVFFEQMFPDLVIEDANKPMYVASFDPIGIPPTIQKWQVASTHGSGIGEVWVPFEDGYIEPRTDGISRVCVWFEKPMDTNNTDLDIISIYSEDGSVQLHPCSVEWDGSYRMIFNIKPALPDGDSYEIIVGLELESAAGYVLVGDCGVRLSALKGDANHSSAVNAQDLLAVRSHIGETISPDNARFDINQSGQINSQDMLAVYANIGNSCPQCSP